jgi:hypothetical protein
VVSIGASVVAHTAAGLLDVAAVAFLVQASTLAAARGLGGGARSRRHEDALDEVDELFFGVVEVIAVTIAGDEQIAVVGEAPRSSGAQAQLL